MNKWDFIPTKKKQDPYEEVIPLLNPCTPEEFLSMDPEEKIEIIEQIFNEIRKINIFPIFYFNEEGIKEEIQKAINKEVGFMNDEISIYYSEGLLLLDYLFPNLHSVITAGGSMIDRFYDDDKLKECIRSYFITRPIYNMRTVFFSTARFKWNTAINYNPMRAKTIYEKFCPENGVVYDFCAGFGGRMLGALSSKKNLTYIGTDPNTETYQNLLKTGKYIEEVTGRKDSFKIYNECAEDLKLEKESVDFCFSCPPFFALEKYTTEETQSYIKYPSYEDWLENFVRPTIKNCVYALKPIGIYCVDVEDFEYRHTQYNLPLDWIQITQEEGLYLQKVYPINSRSRKRDKWTNNIYVFTKDKDFFQDYVDPKTLEEWQRKVIENRERSKLKTKIIGEYNIQGQLENTYNYYDERLKPFIKEIKESSKKHKIFQDKYYAIYENQESVLQGIKTTAICKINNKYYYSFAEIGRYLGVSRQAVHQASKRKQKTINGYDIQWIE